MAVTIDEMHVDIQQAPPAASATTNSNTEPKKEVNLHEALRLLHERKLRLKAD